MAEFSRIEQRLPVQPGENIDWRAVMLEKCQREGLEVPQAVLFTADDGYQQICTQDNTTIYLSRLHDDTDAITELDPRDDSYWAYFRDELGNDRFNELSEGLQKLGACAVVLTMWPTKSMETVWFNRQLRDTIPDELPDGFE